MDFTVLAAGSAMVMTALALIKHVRGGQYGDALTIVALTLVGFGIAVLVCESDFASGTEFGGKVLSDLNTASRFLLGYVLASGARVLYEATNGKVTNEVKLFDNPAPR